MAEFRRLGERRRILKADATMTLEFVLLIHTAEEGGYWAEVPGLEGCFIQGETVEDLLGDAPEAIASHLEALRDDGHRVAVESPIILATVRVPETPIVG